MKRYQTKFDEAKLKDKIGDFTIMPVARTENGRLSASIAYLGDPNVEYHIVVSNNPTFDYPLFEVKTYKDAVNIIKQIQKVRFMPKERVTIGDYL